MPFSPLSFFFRSSMSMMNNSSGIFGNDSNLEADKLSQPDPPVLKKVLDVILITIILFIMLAMGSTITLAEVWKHIKRPISIIIGMISQFVILPLCGFGLSHAVRLEPSAAVGMLVLACSPGGTMSNLFTYWIDGDVSLR